MKLSEIRAALNNPSLDLDTIVDDSTGKTVGDLRKELGVNRESFTKASQRAADLERELQARDARLQEASGQLQHYQSMVQSIEAQKADAQRAAAAEGADWKTDPLYAPIAKHYDAQLDGARKVIGELVTVVKNIATQYQADRTYIASKEDAREIERLKGLHKDFDVDKVREAAKKYQINDWGGAYHAWKGEQADTLIAERERIAREEGMKLATEKSAAPVVEMGGGAPAARPVGEEGKPKDWGSAWGGLVGDLKELGVSA